jgi:ComF family protein
MNPRLSFHRTLDAVFVLLYPMACRVCGASIESWRDGPACGGCWAEVEAAGQFEAVCLKCGTPVSGLDDAPCGRCESFAFVRARSCGPYRGALRETVLQLKRRPHLPPRLRGLLCEAFARLRELGPIESILPVPLHPSRLAERRFNQSERIARALAAETGLRVDAVSVIRAKQTVKHRVGMGARERARSLEGAFRIRAPRLIQGRHLLIVDDVMTTGSTAHELARTLREGGAQSVAVLTLARVGDEFMP